MSAPRGPDDFANVRRRWKPVFLSPSQDTMTIRLPVPDHTTVSRRIRRLGKVPLMPRKSNGPIHLVVDSRGLKIHVGSARKRPKRRA